MTRGERAANRFVRETVQGRILASFSELGNEPYRRVLRACRADLHLEPDPEDEPRRRVIEAVPVEYRQDLERALTELLDAEFDRRRVAERAAVLIGMAAAVRAGSPSRLDESERESAGKATHAAARAAVEIVMQRALFELLEDTGPEYDRMSVAARGRLEEAVRRDRRTPVRDVERLTNNVMTAVPESHRDQVALALTELSDAETTEASIEQDIGFALGLAFGQAVKDVRAWDLKAVLDAVPSLRQSGRRR
jgi:hypothetical protein